MATRKQPRSGTSRKHSRPPSVSARSRIFRRARGEASKVEARKGAARGGKAGHALEDRNRQQLYEIAKKRGIPGRSSMGKWDLIKAIRKAG